MIDNPQTLPQTKKNSKKTLFLILGIFALLIITIIIIILVLSPGANPESISKDHNQYNWSSMDQGPYHDRISFATSTSLTSWIDSEKIIAEHASVPDVIYKDGILYVYFVDVTVDGIPEQIGLLTSSDKGQTWNDKQIVEISGLGDKIAVDPDPYLLEDGNIRLYYFDIGATRVQGGGYHKIYSAISADGINFVEEAGERFSYPDVYDSDVVKVGNIWRMYTGTGDQKVLSATSDDGLTFIYEGVALDGWAIPNVVYENNQYYLFVGGIAIYSSNDGKTFTSTVGHFDSGGLTADPGVVKLGNNEYFMVYKTNDGSPQNQNTNPALDWPSSNAKYITAMPVDLTQIQSISKYRSCAGHDRSGYSFQQTLEEDRSMKHYFYPVTEFQGTIDKVEMYAPFDGTVFSIDWEEDKIGGRPNNGNGIAFSNNIDKNVKFMFGHIYFVKDFEVGDSVRAGDLIGYAALGDIGNDFDIDLIGMDGVVGREILGSIFNHMTDNVLAEFESYGVTPENIIASKESRDANPCNYTGVDNNNSELGARDNPSSWVQLNH